MPRGDKSKYTDKQERKADHIAESYEERGLSEKEAERRAWATVNKMTGGGRKSGSGRGHRLLRGSLREFLSWGCKQRAGENDSAKQSCRRADGAYGPMRESDHDALLVS